MLMQSCCMYQKFRALAWLALTLHAELILPIRGIRKLHRAPETPGGPLALKDDLILVLFLNLASGYENMNDHFLIMLETKKLVESVSSRGRDTVSQAYFVSMIRDGVNTDKCECVSSRAISTALVSSIRSPQPPATQFCVGPPEV